MPKDQYDRTGASASTGAEPRPERESDDYLTYSNIRRLIDQHLEERSLMIDVHTRYLLSRLSETAGQQAERKRERMERMRDDRDGERED